jgi:YebC/PmpR family DNA-binding regulatory protein
MAGHSKWANIQHRKKAQDNKRGKLFTKLIREITSAARLAGSDPDANPRLRLAIDKALSANMGRDTVERAAKRGAGELDGDNYEEIRYEGYGPNGVAVMVDTLTDNRNRTVAEVRHLFTKFGGSLGTDGSVAYLFTEMGEISLAPGADEEQVMEVALDAGADDVITDEDGAIEILVSPAGFADLLEAVKEAGIEPDLAELSSIADALERLANTLVMLDLNKLAGVSREEASKLRGWEAESRLPGDDELYRLADSVLGIEDAVMQIVTRGITSETDALAGGERKREESVYLREALYVVADEARGALTLAKRAITAFIESDYDKLHLANLPATLHSIWGGLQMVNDPGAAGVLERVAASIQERLLDAKEAPAAQVLEALADALTSLEYCIESIGKSEDRNVDLLKLAESSLDDVGL